MLVKGRRKYKNVLSVWMFIFMLFSAFGVFSQESNDEVTQKLFLSNEILKIRLEADFKSVFSNKDDVTYFPAKLDLNQENDDHKAINIDIRTRGNTRRMNDVCLFSPLRLRFPIDGALDAPFENQRAIKLVTHCKKASVYEQNTIIEYLVYRTFNLLTDSSFKVRPAIINYVYQGQKKDSIQRFAFFIERDRHLAERINGRELEDVKIHPNRLNVKYGSLMDLFQYMIGNTDYSSYEMHNIVLVTDELNKLPPIGIPYDFDWCGLVSAFYAKPNSMLNTVTVSERVYRGFKKPIEIINGNIELFNLRKTAIYDLFNDFELLKKSERKRIIKYLDEFYETINDPRMVRQEFMENARVLHN